MKTLGICSLLLYLLGSGVWLPAQPHSPDWTVRPEDNSLLFRVSGKGIKKCAYLYGTIHDICEEDVDLRPETLKALSKSKQVFFEVNINDPKEQLIGRLGLSLPSDSSLRMMLTDEEFNYATRFFADSLHLDIEQYESIRPMLLFGVIYKNVYDCLTTLPYEKILMAQARLQKKEIKGLDKTIEMVHMYDKIPVKKQAYNFMHALHTYNPRAMGRAYRKMFDAYKANDLRSLTAIIFDDKVMSVYVKGLEDLLLTERNKRWLPVILKAASEKPSFFAVGAAHLVGTGGLISLLREKGYKVEAVR